MCAALKRIRVTMRGSTMDRKIAGTARRLSTGLPGLPGLRRCAEATRERTASEKTLSGLTALVEGLRASVGRDDAEVDHWTERTACQFGLLESSFLVLLRACPFVC